MKQYYLKDGEKVRGPFLIDDLKYQRLRPDTLVKVDDGKWQPISHVDDLLFLLKDNGGGNTYSSATITEPSSTKNQNAPLSQEHLAKKRAMITIVIAIMFVIMGLAFSIFFMTASNR